MAIFIFKLYQISAQLGSVLGLANFWTRWYQKSLVFYCDATSYVPIEMNDLGILDLKKTISGNFLTTNPQLRPCQPCVDLQKNRLLPPGSLKKNTMVSPNRMPTLYSRNTQPLYWIPPTWCEQNLKRPRHPSILLQKLPSVPPEAPGPDFGHHTFPEWFWCHWGHLHRVCHTSPFNITKKDWLPPFAAALVMFNLPKRDT